MLGRSLNVAFKQGGHVIEGACLADIIKPLRGDYGLIEEEEAGWRQIFTSHRFILSSQFIA